MTTNDPSDTFRQEAQELLEQLEQALLDLADRRDDQDLIDSTFRALHTIKGSGSMFGFDAVAAFTHYVETAFDMVRKGVVPLSTDILTVALTAKDHIRNLIEHPGPDVESQGSAILANLERVIDNASSGDAVAASSPAAEPAPAPVSESTAALRTAWRIRLPESARAPGTPARSSRSERPRPPAPPPGLFASALPLVNTRHPAPASHTGPHSHAFRMKQSAHGRASHGRGPK